MFNTAWNRGYLVVNNHQSVLVKRSVSVFLYIYDCCFFYAPTSPPPDDLLNHPCLKQLERDLDIQHTCGYIRLLKSGAPALKPRTPRHAVRKTVGDKTKNAEISSFLDDLRELGIGQSQTEEPTETTVQNGTEAEEISRSDNSEEESDTMSPVERKIASEWVPLELSFGIPLFSDKDNTAVCDKVSPALPWCPH